MMQSLLLAVQSYDDSPAVWSQTGTPIIISLTCIVVLFIASRVIEKPHVGPKMPLGPLGPIFRDISLAGFIGAMSFGHILGAVLVLVAAR